MLMKRNEIDFTTGEGRVLVGKIIKFAVPSIVAMLVIAMYNIVDQLFIGNVIGELGNAATNIAFPLTNLCIALGLLFGIGGAAAFNLKLGAGEKEEAPFYLGNAVSMLIISGVVLFAVVEIFLAPLMRLFGSPETVLPYAMDYARVLAIGFPFTIFGSGAAHLLRADGRPNLAMLCNISGGIINIGLDALFIMVLGWGMAGAAWATVIGQISAGLFALWFIMHGKTFHLKAKHYIRKGCLLRHRADGQPDLDDVCPDPAEQFPADLWRHEYLRRGDSDRLCRHRLQSRIDLCICCDRSVTGKSADRQL